MKVLYILYQLFIALPILLVLTILTAIVTIIGSWIGDPHFWGYYPGKIWSQLFCYVLLIPVKVVGHPEVLKKNILRVCSQSSRIFRYLPYLWFSGTKL